MTGADDGTSTADLRRIPDVRTALPRLDHAAIGNGRVLALVGPDSSLEWLCLPRFDSPSLFGALLDPERGGVFRFLVNGAPLAASQMDYVPNTNVLRSLMRRYTNPDDLGSTMSAFMMCSFWWAEALALAGKLGDACAVFARVVCHANRLGLFSKDIDPETGHLLGNFPHVDAHVGLINAAITIGALLDARDGRVRAWS